MINTQHTYFKQAIKTALATSICGSLYLIFAIPEGFWMVIFSAIMMQTDLEAGCLDESLKRGLMRILGTILGTTIGLLCLTITLKYKLLCIPIGFVIVTLCTYYIESQSECKMVSASALIIMLISSHFSTPWYLSLYRTLSIILGGAITIAVSLFIFPYRHKDILNDKLLNISKHTNKLLRHTITIYNHDFNPNKDDFNTLNTCFQTIKESERTLETMAQNLYLSKEDIQTYEKRIICYEKITASLKSMIELKANWHETKQTKAINTSVLDLANELHRVIKNTQTKKHKKIEIDKIQFLIKQINQISDQSLSSLDNSVENEAIQKNMQHFIQNLANIANQCCYLSSFDHK